MVKILFFPFLLLLVGGMIIFVIRRRKLLGNRKIVFLIITILVMTLLRSCIMDSVSSRYYIFLLIPGIPFAAYLSAFAPVKLNPRIVNSVFFIVVCICIGKALKPRHPKAYIPEMSNALSAIVQKSGISKVNIYDFSGETRRLRFHSGFAVQAAGEICASPELRTRQLHGLINSQSPGKGAVYFIFREKDLETAKEIYRQKNGEPLPVKEIFRSESRRNDGGCYVIVRLCGFNKTRIWR
ncbi:MAG: hypothetical protein PHV82_11165 [Victivallaceae bacterium]|nr:hypothetical protein [Victivallaceae bacterium]